MRNGEAGLRHWFENQGTLARQVSTRLNLSPGNAPVTNAACRFARASAWAAGSEDRAAHFLVLCVLVEVRSDAGVRFLKNVAPGHCGVRATGSDMSTIDDVSGVLRSLAPHHLAEDWDNVGLLVGDRERPVKRIMTCLTVTPESVQEAIDQQVELIVAHHPIPFRPLKRLTTEETTGRLLLLLIDAGIAVYSPHTAFDSARDGINQRLAEGVGLLRIQPLEPIENDPDGLGAGRWGELAESLALVDVAARLKEFLKIEGLHMVGAPTQPIQRVAVACGSAGQFLGAAQQHQCDLLITGETSFHTCLAAAADQIAMLLPGHYASERFAVESLAESLGRHFPELVVWASQEEADPLQWI